MIQHWAQAYGEKRTLEHQGTFLIDYRRVTHQKTILNSGSSVYTIDTGKTRGTTFKIDTGGYVFFMFV